VRPTASFEIRVFDQNAGLIAAVSSKVTFTPTPGGFKNLSLLPTIKVGVYETSDVVFNFAPLHRLTTNS